ncbi:hypothetical protein [Sediminitomix flava]|uniref:Uncharacterized protein n=1 Tax=Sediminitomix flava TaxID=379075 RepID=A0A315Z2X0_SEDFL|nr:hypothetical protein [Sediminitomix flava]PWJ36146.1 hypothetical protein BC781_109165 [Sediminitomix flava]
MLEYSKMILEKVAFDKTLFEKELRKAMTILPKDDKEELKRWCKQNFKITIPFRDPASMEVA